MKIFQATNSCVFSDISDAHRSVDPDADFMAACTASASIRGVSKVSSRLGSRAHEVSFINPDTVS